MKFRNKSQFFDVVIIGLVWRWGFSLHDHAGIETIFGGKWGLRIFFT